MYVGMMMMLLSTSSARRCFPVFLWNLPCLSCPCLSVCLSRPSVSDLTACSFCTRGTSGIVMIPTWNFNPASQPASQPAKRRARILYLPTPYSRCRTEPECKTTRQTKTKKKMKKNDELMTGLLFCKAPWHLPR